MPSLTVLANCSPNPVCSYQLVTPFYALDNISLTYHDILFNRDHSHLSTVLCYFSSCKDWTQCLQDISEGLEHIHELGLVYRDLKEDNIVLYKVGIARMHAVLIDFGKCLPESTCTVYYLSDSQRETYHKKHRHISPELVDDAAKPSSASDVYSLGRIIKHTLLHSTIDLQVWPKRLKDICRQSLKYSPLDRPAVCEVLCVINDCLTQFQLT